MMTTAPSGIWKNAKRPARCLSRVAKPSERPFVRAGWAEQRIAARSQLPERGLALPGQMPVAGPVAHLEQVLVTVLDKVRALLPRVTCAIWLADMESGELVCQQATGSQSKGMRGRRLAREEGVVGWVVHTGESAIVSDTQAKECSREDVGSGYLASSSMLRSILCIPLRANGHTIGALEVRHGQTNRFDLADLALLKSLAALAAMAIASAWQVETSDRRVCELEACNEELALFDCNVAHDLKSPLCRMVGLAEILESDSGTMSAEEIQHYLSVIAQNGRTLSGMVDAFLLLAGACHREVEIMPLDMESIVSEVLERLTRTIEQYQAKIVLPDSWPAAIGYRPWVEEVWANTISNACKYGGRSPRIELGASPPFDSPPQGGSEEGMIRFWVRDNGPGLSLEQQAQLFTPLTRLHKERAPGNGLGLSVVRRIVEKLGGQVSVQSDGVPGRGSVFSFTLPGAAR
ncbi:MAG: GAF domain-containing sensor histidine kinase [Anaerolineae bacterium]|nr:GAF domain-containing sensor histidine kinase [Anaerolineae bacterium]